MAEGVVPVAGGGFGGELAAEGRGRCRRRGEGEEEKDESVGAKERSLVDRGGPRGFSLSPAPPGRTQLAGFGLGRRIKNGPNPAKNEALGGRWGATTGKMGRRRQKGVPGGGSREDGWSCSKAPALLTRLKKWAVLTKMGLTSVDAAIQDPEFF